MANFGDEGPPSVWQLWMTRILVTAAIAFAVEYLGRQPAPWLKKKNKQDEEVVVEETDASRNKSRDLAYSKLAAAAVAKDNDDNKQASSSSSLDDDKETASDKIAAKNGISDETTVRTAKTKESPQSEEKEEGENPKPKPSPSKTKAKESGDNSKAKKTSKKANKDTTESTTEEPTKVTFRNKSPYHPGMEGYHNWYDIECSLFRQYTVGRSDGVDALPPYVPKSRNGQVRVALRVTNDLTDSQQGQTIKVYWMNYMGHEEFKGDILRGETWTQTTYVEHPWVFRLSGTEELLLHYIPERVIPHLEEAPTIEEAHPMVGVQRITITRPTEQAQEEDHHICSIVDTVMPHPGRHHFHTPDQAHSWTLLQMTRSTYFDYHPGATLLHKYLTNIAMHPDNCSYRSIRVANKNFYQGIWQTPARGLLLAAGFAEQHANAELGTAEPLPSEGVQQVSLVLLRLEQYLTQLKQQQEAAEGKVSQQQPNGADGSGRAGYGRAGQMN